MSNRTYADDLRMGASNEQSVMPLLEQHFGEELKPTQAYCSYDFESVTSNTKYELKSRRNAYDKYPTTIIAVNKCQTVGPLCFVFHFTNGLYYCYYNSELFSTFNIKQVRVFRDGVWGQTKAHYEIPISQLVRINI